MSKNDDYKGDENDDDLKIKEITKQYKMEEGDYIVSVKILEVNDLTETSDAFVEMELNGVKKRTKVIKKTNSPIFNQQFTFSVKDLKKERLRDISITFSVQNRKLFKNHIIGIYQLDLSVVYYSLYHELYRTYLALSDPNDENDGERGYLLLSIQVLGPKDEPVIHDSLKEKLQTKEKSLIPRKIKTYHHCICVKLFRGEHFIPIVGFNSEINAYVEVTFAGMKKKSKPSKSSNPIWNEKVELGIQLPNQSKMVIFKVYDRDLLHSDTLIGCFRVLFDSFKNQKDRPPEWINIYGPPIECKQDKKYKDYRDLMTLEGDKMGSHYRGRILLQLSSYDSKNPNNTKKENNQIQIKFPDKPLPIVEQQNYLLRIDILEGHELPERKYSQIHIVMGPYHLCTKPIKQEMGTSYFYEALEDKKVLFPKDIQYIPDIIFYFTDENIEHRRHCFYRQSAKEVLNVERKPKLIKFQEDRSLDLVRDDEFPGFLYANIQLLSDNPGERINLSKIQRPKIEYQLRVYLYIGRKIPPADNTGTSDPFVLISCAGKKQKSKLMKQTLNPSWYETLYLDVTLLPLEDSSEIPSGMFVVVYDDDGGYDYDVNGDLIGRIWIEFQTELIKFQNEDGQIIDIYYKKPKWYNIHYDVTDEISGQILLNYALIKKDEAHLVPEENMQPDSKKTNINIFLIGLRNIEPLINGIEPQKCFLTFDISGDQNEQNRFDANKTEPNLIKQCGTTINDLMEISIDVPKNQNFCPVIEVFLWNETNNFQKTLLGTAQIQLENILSSYYKPNKNQFPTIQEQKNDDDDIDKLDKVIENNEKQQELAILSQNKTSKNQEQEQLDSLNDEDKNKIIKSIPKELYKKIKILEDDEYQKKFQEINQEYEELLHSQNNRSNKIISQDNNQLSLFQIFQPIERHGGDQNIFEEHISNPVSNSQIEIDQIESSNHIQIDSKQELLLANSNNSNYKLKQQEVLFPNQQIQNNIQIGHSEPNSIKKASKNSSIRQNSLQQQYQQQQQQQQQQQYQQQQQQQYQQQQQQEQEQILVQGEIQVNNINDSVIQSQQKNVGQYGLSENLSSKQFSINYDPNGIQHPIVKNHHILQSKNNGQFLFDGPINQMNQQDNNNVYRSERSKIFQDIMFTKNQRLGQILQSDARRSSIQSIKKLNGLNQELILNSENHIKSQSLIQQQLKELPDERIFKTLRQGTNVSFSRASVISSKKLSIVVDNNNKDIDDQNNKIQFQEPLNRNMPSPKSLFLSRFNGKLKKLQVPLNISEKETYEEYDSIDDEDLNIDPEWKKGREKHLQGDLESFYKKSKKLMKIEFTNQQIRGDLKKQMGQQKIQPDVIGILKCIFVEETELNEMQKKKNYYKKLMTSKEYQIRIYILDAVLSNDSEEQDNSKIYLRINLCGQNHDLEKQTLCEQKTPEFYFRFDHAINIPGPSTVRISIMVQNNIPMLGNEELCHTDIDVEDRYLTKKWHDRIKPIEMRKLHTPDGAQCGNLKMWIDLIPIKNIKQNRPIFIEPPPRYKFELRVIIWETRKCVFKDDISQSNDVYVKCRLASPSNPQEQTTDVHYICRGTGSFNWRMKFQTQFPNNQDEYAQKFIIQIWDKDLVKQDDLIGEITYDLNTSKMIDKAVKRQKSVKMKQLIREKVQITDRFWLDVYNHEMDEQDKPISQGQVLISFELVPEKIALEKPVGYGRETPNIDPFLENPVGRLGFDIQNPFDYFKRVFGDTLYLKVKKQALIGVYACIGIYLLWQIISGLISLAIF